MSCDHCGQGDEPIAQSTAVTVVCQRCTRKAKPPLGEWPSTPGLSGSYWSVCGRYMIDPSPAGYRPVSLWNGRTGPSTTSIDDAKAWCAGQENIRREFQARMLAAAARE